MSDARGIFEGMDRASREVIAAASSDGLALRTIGGVAVWQRLPDHDRRAYEAVRSPPKDLDAIAPRRSSQAIQQVFAAAGYVADERLIAWHGDHRHRYVRVDDAGEPVIEVDVFLGRAPACHPFDLEDFTAVPGPAIGSTDLLLQKLQIVESSLKDLLDVAFLLATHEPEQAERDGTLSAARVADLLSRDWGFHHTATENLDKAERAAAEMLEAEPASRAVEHARRLREAVDAAPKSGRWKLRARVGTRKQWYEDVEELDR